MQSKISAFFKPSTSNILDSSHVSDSIEDVPLFDTTKEPEISITYTRRTPKTDLCRSEENDGKDVDRKPSNSGSVDALVKPVSKSGKLQNKKRSYAQYHLEFGQTDFLLHNCSICGIKYARGIEEDEKVHKEFHKNYISGIPFKGWRNERIVPMDVSDNSRIVLVSDSDPSVQQNKVREVARMMEGELGKGWLLHKLCKVYLFISAKRISGCLVAEPILNAYKVISSSGVQKISNFTNTKPDRPLSTVLQFGTVNFRQEITKRVISVNRNELFEDHNGAIFCEEEAVPASCGIRAIWVAPSSRRIRVATKLLDAARISFCTGYALERSQLAFSQPTSAGKALASSYSGTESFLVYNTGLNN